MILTGSCNETIDPGRVAELSPLVLAYIGDAVYDMYIRTVAVKCGLANINDLHNYVVGFVCASAQSKAVHSIMDKLTYEEVRVFKRGRNAKSAPPKNADVVEYKNATGFESLLGYLYIKGDEKRLDEILQMAALSHETA